MRFMGPALGEVLGDGSGQQGTNPCLIRALRFCRPGVSKGWLALEGCLIPFLRSRRPKRIVELVGVLSTLDFDRHGAAEAFQLVASGVRYNRNDQRGYAAVHDAGVLQNEGAF